MSYDWERRCTNPYNKYGTCTYANCQRDDLCKQEKYDRLRLLCKFSKRLDNQKESQK